MSIANKSTLTPVMMGNNGFSVNSVGDGFIVNVPTMMHSITNMTLNVSYVKRDNLNLIQAIFHHHLIQITGNKLLNQPFNPNQLFKGEKIRNVLSMLLAFIGSLGPLS